MLRDMHSGGPRWHLKELSEMSMARDNIPVPVPKWREGPWLYGS